jgi:hypothetical protein
MAGRRAHRVGGRGPLAEGDTIAAMSAEYGIVSQVHLSKLDETGRNAVEGWEITFRDGQTGVTGSIFLSDDTYTPDNARMLILDKLGTIRAVHSLSE